MANQLLWDARPTGAVVMATTSVAPAGLRDADANEILIAAADVANGTALYTHADFLLYLHDFDAAPAAGSYVELHIIYEFATVYGDGEDGDVSGTPRLTGNTLAAIFPVYAGDENQAIQVMGIETQPHDFRCILVPYITTNIADGDGSYLTIFPYGLELQ